MHLPHFSLLLSVSFCLLLALVVVASLFLVSPAMSMSGYLVEPRKTLRDAGASVCVHVSEKRDAFEETRAEGRRNSAEATASIVSHSGDFISCFNYKAVQRRGNRAHVCCVCGRVSDIAE